MPSLWLGSWPGPWIRNRVAQLVESTHPSSRILILKLFNIFFLLTDGLLNLSNTISIELHLGCLWSLFELHLLNSYFRRNSLLIKLFYIFAKPLHVLLKIDLPGQFCVIHLVNVRHSIVTASLLEAHAHAMHLRDLVVAFVYLVDEVQVHVLSLDWLVRWNNQVATRMLDYLSALDDFDWGLTCRFAWLKAPAVVRCADSVDFLRLVSNFWWEVCLSLAFLRSWRHSWSSFNWVGLSCKILLNRYLWAASLPLILIELSINLIIIGNIGLLNSKIRYRINIWQFLTWIIQLLAKVSSADIQLVLLWLLVLLDVGGYWPDLSSLVHWVFFDMHVVILLVYHLAADVLS